MKTMKRILSLFAICVVLTLTSGDILAMAGFATCLGADPCNACKNCRYCRHCAVQGGTCGVCKR